MHCDPKFIKTISEAVNGVIKSTCPNKGDEQTPQTALIASLFDVVEAFRQDLYPDEFEKFDKEDRDYAIKKFDMHIRMQMRVKIPQRSISLLM